MNYTDNTHCVKQYLAFLKQCGERIPKEPELWEAAWNDGADTYKAMCERLVNLVRKLDCDCVADYNQVCERCKALAEARALLRESL